MANSRVYTYDARDENPSFMLRPAQAYFCLRFSVSFLPFGIFICPLPFAGVGFESTGASLAATLIPFVLRRFFLLPSGPSAGHSH